MPFIALLILCLAAISCDKKVVRSVDVPVEDVAVEDVPTEDVLANTALVCSGSLQLPTGAGMLAEDLQVLSLFGEVTPNAAGAFSISMADSKSPQFVFATDPATDNSLLLGYVNPLQGEQVHLSCESTAVGLAFLSPLMMGTTAEQRSEFISGIKAHPNFSLLVEAVEATFQADPQHVLDYTAHPELYQQAAEISVDVWQQMTAAGKLLAPAAAQENVCEQDKEANVWITDGPGNDIVFCNPKMVFYVAALRGHGGYRENDDFVGFEFNHSLSGAELGNDFLDFVHINPKQRAISIRPQVKFWNVGAPPQSTEYTLPIDGTIDYHITRGYGFFATGFGIDPNKLFDWDTAYGRASMLNIGQGIIHTVHLLTGIHLSIPKKGFIDDTWEIGPLSAGLGEAQKGSTESDISTIDRLINFAQFVTKNFKHIEPKLKTVVWGSVNVEDVPKINKAFGTVSQVFAGAALAIKGYRFANQIVPFFVDLLSAGPEFRGQFLHENSIKGASRRRKEGVITEVFPVPGGESIEFVWIEGGHFTMGARPQDPKKQENESPRRPVEISEGFWLGSHEVTQGQWEAVMEGAPWSGASQVNQHPLHPAVMISWDEVQEFIARLNETAGDWKYRLPTEAEWEYACRAGTETPWSFGDDESLLKDYAWYQDNIEGNDYAHPVWMKEANPWGLYDMHGNVREWVHDWLGIYSYTPGPASASFIDPQGPSTGSDRVIRGGSFAQPAQNLRSTYRRGKNPEDRDPETGFRLVRIKEPEPPWEEETFELPREGDAEITMVWIEPGTFEMGADSGDNSPQHPVEISKGFWLGMHEVTQGQWYEVMGTTPWAGQDWALEDSVAWHPSYPATYISWDDVQEFIARLNEAEGGRYYRLPTEAEWEYACRAGTPTDWPWSFGDDWNELTNYAWYALNTRNPEFPSEKYAQVVNLKRANPWGLRDMHGNVAEWVQDLYDPGYYSISPQADPLGPLWPPTSNSDPNRVVRGGSFKTVEDTESASRGYHSPSTLSAEIGFRLVRLLEPEREALAEAPREHTFSLGGADMKMVRIKRGAFEMGTSDYPNASPHEVEISKNFWLGTHEVTRGQWEAVMGGTEWAAPWDGQSNVRPPSLGVDLSSYPAVYISWEDVQEFLVRLNEMEGRYYRLPTEAEWEYACRAGTTTPWSFGDDESHLRYYAWSEGIASYALSVGFKRANPWGLRDMHGNVAEWVQDWYDEDYYNESPVIDPQGPSWPPFDTAPHRVIRGGGFNTFTAFTESAFRWIAPPGSGSPSIGFRLVRDVTTQQEVPTQQVTLPGNASMEFVRVEPGVFLMGSPESEKNRGSDETLHEVEISTGFWLGTYEVTQDQWYAVMETTPWDGAGNQVNPSHPAGASWDAVQAFIDRLNAAAGEQRYRLPTEAEWEYACRAGMPTRWSFGDDERRLEYYAWSDLEDAQGVQPVGTKRANAWGLHDMHGNVWEWVQDWYDEDYYASSPRVDPPGA